MKYTMKFIDGASIVTDKTGEVAEYYNPDNELDGTVATDGFPEICGLWSEADGIVTPWEHVITQLSDPSIARQVLYGNLFLDNGQVVDEGKLVDILIDGVSILNNWDIEQDVAIFTAECIENGGSYDRCMHVLRTYHKVPEAKVQCIRNVMDRHIWEADNQYEWYTRAVNVILDAPEGMI